MAWNMDKYTVAQHHMGQTRNAVGVPVWMNTVKKFTPVEAAPLARPIYTFWLAMGGGVKFYRATGLGVHAVNAFTAGESHPGLAELASLYLGAGGAGKGAKDHALFFGRFVGALLLGITDPMQTLGGLVYAETVRQMAWMIVDEMNPGPTEARNCGCWAVSALAYTVRLAGAPLEKMDHLARFCLPQAWPTMVLTAAARQAEGLAGLVPVVEGLGEVEAPPVERLVEVYLGLPKRVGLGAEGSAHALEFAANGEVVRRKRGRPKGGVGRVKVLGRGVGIGPGLDAPIDEGH